jgi:hypothetical protein
MLFNGCRTVKSIFEQNNLKERRPEFLQFCSAGKDNVQACGVQDVGDYLDIPCNNISVGEFLSPAIMPGLDFLKIAPNSNFLRDKRFWLSWAEKSGWYLAIPR